MIARNWRISLVAAAAVLSLQACDVSIKPPSTTSQNTGTVTETVQAPAAPAVDTTAVAPSADTAATTAATPAASDTAAAAATPPADATVQPAPPASENIAAPAGASPSTDPATIAAMQPPPAAPETAAMGAQPVAGAATPALPAAAPGLAVPVTVGDGTAAPTELSRFFDESEARKAAAAAKTDAKKDPKKKS